MKFESFHQPPQKSPEDKKAENGLLFDKIYNTKIAKVLAFSALVGLGGKFASHKTAKAPQGAFSNCLWSRITK